MPKASTAALTLNKRAYTRLLADLRQLLEEGRVRAEEALGRELIQTYHAVGSRIATEKLTERAGYGSAILAELADELGLHVRVLQQALRFAHLYPRPPADATSLRWAHFRELLRVKDDTARQWYQSQAQAQRWTGRKLAEAIASDAHARKQRAPAKMPRKATQPSVPRPKEATYVYKAEVERVIDGDTLLLLIDLGFHVLKRQRVRLARLDTPPLREAGGKAAQAYVRDALAQVDFVVVKTNKVDLYGRYVGHVFYGPGLEDEQQVFAKGRYLNQELVKGGLARVL